LGVGLALNNTLAVLEAMAGRRRSFSRTPKFCLERAGDTWQGKEYGTTVDWTVWAELALAGYAAVALCFAVKLSPHLVPALGLAALGYGFVGGMGLWQGLIYPKTTGLDVTGLSDHPYTWERAHDSDVS
jgi:hypothetical protein